MCCRVGTVAEAVRDGIPPGGGAGPTEGNRSRPALECELASRAHRALAARTLSFHIPHYNYVSVLVILYVYIYCIETLSVIHIKYLFPYTM